MPGIYKIGFTDRSPMNRIEELSKSTSVPISFDILASIEVENAEQVERQIHFMLDAYRINGSREFFKCDTDRIIEAFYSFSSLVMEYEELIYERWREEARKRSELMEWILFSDLVDQPESWQGDRWLERQSMVA